MHAELYFLAHELSQKYLTPITLKPLGMQLHWLTLVTEIIAVYCKLCMKPVNTLCRQNRELFLCLN
jgi:hypothetical protein